MINKNKFFKFFGLVSILVLSFFSVTGFAFSKAEQSIALNHENPLILELLPKKIGNQFEYQANLINKSSKPVEIEYSKSPYSMEIKTNEKNPQIVFTRNASTNNNTTTKKLEPSESFNLINIATDKIEIQSGKYNAEINIEYHWRYNGAEFISTKDSLKIPLNLNNNVSVKQSPTEFSELAIKKAVEEELDIDLSELKQYGYNDLHQLLNPENHFLVKVFKNIEKEAVEGDYLPILFIDKNTAHFVVHKSDGKNFVYTLSKSKNEWDLKNIITKEL